MVLQVLADPGALDRDRDALRAECRGVADPRQHQELRRVDDAAREDDLALRPGGAGGTTSQIFDADGAAVFEDDARGERAGLDREVGPAERRTQIGFGGAAPATVADRLLDAPEPFLLRTVVIRGGGEL